MVLLFGSTFAAPATEYTPVRSGCQKNHKQKQCKKVKKPQRSGKHRSKLNKLPPVAEPSRGSLGVKPLLSSKQEAIRDAFSECIRHVTEADRTRAVVDFVFQEQTAREENGLRSFWQALRGSPEHHGQEVCLARTFGLRGFRDLADIRNEAGDRLVEISSPYVDVVTKEIPPDRRYTRPWVRDYIAGLARDMHQHFAKDEQSGEHFVPLRVTSMIRSFEDQAKEVRRGLSPADCRYAFLCSTHTSGSSLDLGLKDIGQQKRAWLESRLIADQQKHKILFIIERSHYHVFVLPPEYMGEE